MFHEGEEARNPDPSEPGHIEAEGLAEGDAHAAGETREAAGPAFADRLDLDVALRSAIKLDEDERRVRAAVFRQIEAGKFLAVGVIENARIGVRDRTEVLAAFDAFVDRESNDDILDVGAKLGEVDLDRLVLACAVTGAFVDRKSLVWGKLGSVWYK